MTNKKETPDLSGLSENSNFLDENNLVHSKDIQAENQVGAGKSDSSTADPLQPEINIDSFPYVPDAKIVHKMQTLVQQKQEEAKERERLAQEPKQPYRREEPRVGRNDPCPCGSGKKYKKCHMGKDLEAS